MTRLWSRGIGPRGDGDLCNKHHKHSPQFKSLSHRFIEELNSYIYEQESGVRYQQYETGGGETGGGGEQVSVNEVTGFINKQLIVLTEEMKAVT